MLALSLPSSYLNDTTDDDAAGAWRTMIGPPEQALPYLAGLGVGAIEIGDVRGRADAGAVTQALQVIHDAGLEPHAHLWLPRDFDPSRPPATLVAAVHGLARTPRSGRLRQRQAACAVHGHHRDTPDAVAASVRDLRALDPWLRERGACAALEVCRFKPGGPIGGTYAEVTELARAAGDEVGVTWDIGHTTWNHRAGHDDLWPDEHFLARVRHVHVHAVGANGRTHFALGHGQAPLAGFVGRLLAVGYDGLWDVELYPGRWQGSPSARRRALEGSIARLSEVLA